LQKGSVLAIAAPAWNSADGEDFTGLRIYVSSFVRDDHSIVDKDAGWNIGIDAYRTKHVRDRPACRQFDQNSFGAKGVSDCRNQHPASRRGAFVCLE
jgi:hypothetical protein